MAHMIAGCSSTVVDATRVVSYILIVSFACVLIIGFFGLTAAYGKMLESGQLSSRVKINPKLGWFIQEFPSFALPLLTIITQWPSLTVYQVVMLSMMVAHYFQRSIVYPLLMRSNRRTPVTIVASAFAFCSINGWLQSMWVVCSLNDEDANKLNIAVGVGLYLLGFFVNLQSDHILRNLRKNAQENNQYFIPYGGMFRFVTCPNYLGEMIEWFGYAMASSWGLAPVTFAFTTFANLFPRAIEQRRWYRSKFDDYDKLHRKALEAATTQPLQADQVTSAGVSYNPTRIQNGNERSSAFVMSGICNGHVVLQIFKRAGTSMFVLTNAEYEARRRREDRKAQSDLEELRGRASRQVARCWGQFERLEKERQRSEENKRITQVLNRELDSFREQMYHQTKREEERLRLVYQSLCRPPQAYCREGHFGQKLPTRYPVIETFQVINRQPTPSSCSRRYIKHQNEDWLKVRLDNR
ncbi:3-oxo-5-alpha-steroid 4-dehydrogenase 1 [Perkinsus chesapeaki]|uniref:3-oxo-5-alpha-steroid 4-dehydrogenase 1 n=1 Tax=Perkinsus chesapeaki TaxID=330153 RepID=A0A7J6MNC3_PERCH|nr:3-oxo-5-alpha-steroid 4-dehydrogenase 1 [Perkinsus chesapeaki]